MLTSGEPKCFRAPELQFPQVGGSDVRPPTQHMMAGDVA